MRTRGAGNVKSVRELNFESVMIQTADKEGLYKIPGCAASAAAILPTKTSKDILVEQIDQNLMMGMGYRAQ